MYRLEPKNWLKHLDFMMLDMLCLEISYVLALWVRMGFFWPFNENMYARFGVTLLALHICVVFFQDSYRSIIYRGHMVEIKMAVKYNLALLVGILFYLYVTKQSVLYSRAVIFFLCIFNCIVMIGARLVWKRIIRNRRKEQRERRSILVITDSKSVGSIIDSLEKEYYANFKIIGIILMDQNQTGGEISSIPIVASRDTALQYIKNHIVDEVFISLQSDTGEIDRLSNHLISMGVIVHINLIHVGNNMENSVVERLGEYTVLSTGIKFASEWQLMVKRAMDIAGALVGLVFTGIFFVIFAPIIYKQSPGPIFFGQDRVGKNGRIFKIYKFRSMYPDAEERKKELMSQNKMSGLMFKMDNDPRIIPIGKFIRNTSIDEFPQFWNVLKGDMSLVGTRPPTVQEYEQYEMHHKKRLASKPGITGLWQVSGRSNIVDFEDVVALDAKYISEWNLTLDIKILWKTLLVIFKKEGAV